VLLRRPSLARTTGKRGVATKSKAIELAFDYPLDRSVGALLRMTYRTMAQELQALLAPHGIPIGMWYFLRALWQEDGVTQRELSERVGAMAPTTVEQLRKMEEAGLILRVRSAADRRRIHVSLTEKGRALRPALLPYAAAVNDAALVGLSEMEISYLRLMLHRIRSNLATHAARRKGVERLTVIGPEEGFTTEARRTRRKDKRSRSGP
jgi:DNA-binding MarR family transcriptional regulator